MIWAFGTYRIFEQQLKPGQPRLHNLARALIGIGCSNTQSMEVEEAQTKIKTG